MKTSTTTLLMALALFGLTSCAEDEPVSINAHNGEQISFRPAMGSRATEVTNANLNSFYVTSFLGDTPFFNKVEYSKGSDGFYNSLQPYYWPGDNSNLEFYAFYPSLSQLFPDDIITEADEADFYNTGDAGLVFNSSEKKLLGFRVADSIKNQVDFITAYGTGNRKENESAGLELTFDHRLSQIEIQAKSESTGYTYKVVGARIGRPQVAGSFDFTTNLWTLDEWHDTGVFDASCPEVTLSATPVSIMGDAGNAMFIPQALTPWQPSGDPDNVAREAYLSVLVRITSTDTGAVIYPFPSDTRIDPATNQKRQYAWASIPISTTWEAGKKYVYILDFTNGAGFVDPDDPTPGTPILGDPIKFTVNVDLWEEAPKETPMPLK